MAPQISLTYSSRAKDGLAGAGFAIGGLSQISRCNRTLDQDGSYGAPALTAADLFCLDGNKLRSVSGTYGSAGSVYRTEIDTFARITAYGTAGNGPAYFVVEQKDGLIYEYGNSADSRIESLAVGGGQVATARAWAVNRIRDRSGNAIEFTYEEDTTYGAFRPKEVFWTSNATQGLSAAYKIAFIYEVTPRPDTLYGYRYGDRLVINGQITETKRLDRIDVIYNTSTVVRRYDLAYEPDGGAGGRSRLQSIQECGLGGSDCLSPTSFTWINGTLSWGAEVSTGQAVPTQPLVMDINNDGRDDLVYSSHPTSGSGVWVYMLANSSGSFDPATATGYSNANYAEAHPIEWDGDGRWDVLVPYSGGTWWVMRANGAGFDAPVNTFVPYTTGNSSQWWVADIDGDGRGDLVHATGAGNIHARLRETSGFSPSETLITTITVGTFGTGVRDNAFGGESTRMRSATKQPDFDGDGREDFVIRVLGIDEPDPPNPTTGAVYLCIVMPRGLQPASASCFPTAYGSITTPGPQDWMMGDSNGDGLTDLFWIYQGTAYVLISRGTHLASGSSVNVSAYAPGSAVVADWDGDGRDDLLAANTSTGALWTSRSTGVSLAPFVSAEVSSGTGNFRSVGDMNGDGLPDVMRSSPSGNTWLYSTHLGVPADMLDRVTDGFGNYVDFDYVSIAQANYTRRTDGVYPTPDYQGPVYVVSQYTASDGVGGTYAASYWYEGARINLRGRGFQEFYSCRKIDSRSEIWTHEYFHQTFPYTGLVFQRDLTQSSGSTLVARTQNTWVHAQYGSGFELRYLPYLSSSTSRRNEFGGIHDVAQLATAVTWNTLDPSTGTIIRTSTETSESSYGYGINPGQSYTQTVYHPTLFTDTTNWCIGRPMVTQTTGAHTVYGGATVTRQVDTTWDGQHCRPTQTVSESGDLQWQVTTALDYDGFGNLDSEAVTGIGMPTRTSTAYWGSTGQFPVTVTNALSETTTNGWDPARGVQTSQTDPNNLAVSWQYDNFGRRTRENRPDGTATTWSYNDCSSFGCVNANNRMVVIATELNTSGGTVSDRWTYIDRLERPIVSRALTLSGAYNRIETQYDSSGRVYRQSSPCWWDACTSYWTNFGYDSLNRLTVVSRPVSDSDPTLQFTYVFYEGLATRIVDPSSKVTTQIRDVMDRIVQSQDHDGYYQGFDYDAFGNVVRVTDSAGNTLSSATYNVLGMKMTSWDMDAGNMTYTPNALGEVITQTNALGQSTTFMYDALGRMTAREALADQLTEIWYWGESAQFRNIGRLSGVSSSYGFSEGYVYDSAGRLQTTTVNHYGTGLHQIDYAYNNSGELDTLTYPTSTSGYRLKIQYDYQNGRLLRAKDFNVPSTVFWQANATDPGGAVIDESLGNGLRTYRGYDLVTGALDFIQTGPGGNAAVQNLSYQWDRVGNLTQRQDANRSLTESFYYDNLYRLDYSTRNGVINLDLAYDALGNITYRSDVGDYSYHPTRKHAVASTSNGWTFTYDAAGRMRGGRGSTIDYFASGQVAWAGGASAGAGYDFLYAPDGTLHDVSVAYYGGTGGYETTSSIGGILERVETGAFPSPPNVEYRHQIRAGGRTVAIYTRRSNGTASTYYLTRDHLGSADVITHDNGDLLVSGSFGAFGQRRGANWQGSPSSEELAQMAEATRRGFTDHVQIDRGSFVHMNGRMHDPLIGRFVSPDPYVSDPLNTQSFNRYSYVNNNPLSFTDPTGFQSRREQIAELDDAGLEALREQMRDSAQRAYNFAWFMKETSGGGSNFGGGFGGICVSFACLGGTLLDGFSGVGGRVDLTGSRGSSWTYVSGKGSQGVGPDGVEEVTIRRGHWLPSWLAQQSTVQFCGYACAKAGGLGGTGIFAISENTATNAERVLNAITLLAMPVGAPESLAGRGAIAARGAVATAEGTANAAKGALLRMQLAAEEIAGARMPGQLAGYTKHGINQAISRDGVGVSTRAILDAFQNPTKIFGQAGGRFGFVGRDAVVVVNSEGQVVTTWATGSAGVRIVP